MKLKSWYIAVVGAIVTSLCVTGVSFAQGGGGRVGTVATASKAKAKRGPRGHRGPAGLSGSQGLTGPKGDKGDQGDPGPLVDTLPSGRTLRGTYAVGSTAAAASGFALAPLSFTFPLAAKPSSTIVKGSPTAACPGSLANPQATSGNFCLYVGAEANVSTLGVCDTVVNDCSGPSRFGGGVEIFPTAAGLYFSQGTWAVTG